MMNIEEKVRILQLTYAAALVDATLRMGRERIVERVIAEKRNEQMASGKARAEQFGIKSPEEVFQKLSEIFDCARWETRAEADGFSAEAKSCKLRAIAARMGAPSPCRMYCLDPMEGMVKGLAPETEFTVAETLWSGAKCRVGVGR